MRFQGATVAGPWKRIATYDEVNGVRVVNDQVFDLTACQFLPLAPTAFGSDAGVPFQHTVPQAPVPGGALNDASHDSFAVTAYSFKDTGLPKILETSQVAVTAVPQRPAAGTDLSTASAAPVTYLRKDTNKPPATDVVSVEV